MIVPRLNIPKISYDIFGIGFGINSRIQLTFTRATRSVSCAFIEEGEGGSSSLLNV